MTLQDLQELITFEATAADHATDAATKALHEGRAQAFSFMLQQEIETRAKALYWAIASQYPEDSPAFIQAHDRAAKVQGLPLMARVPA